MEQLLVIDILGLLTVILSLILHEIGHLIAYNYVGIENGVILWRKMCVVIKDYNFIQCYIDFFNNKKEDAWKMQIIMSLSGLLVNIFLVVGWTLAYLFNRNSINDQLSHALVIFIIAWQFITLLLNVISETSDGKKIYYAFKHNITYYLFFENEYVKKNVVSTRIKVVQSYMISKIL